MSIIVIEKYCTKGYGWFFFTLSEYRQTDSMNPFQDHNKILLYKLAKQTAQNANMW
jgi:hypothetical protein